MSHAVVSRHRRVRARTAASALTLLVVAGHSWLPAQAQAQASRLDVRAGSADTIRLSLADARTRALSANPDLAAARLDTSIARGWLRQAGVLRFNPSVDALSGGAGLELGLSQEVEVFGQRGIRITAERAGLARASASIANESRITLGAVDRAFFGLVAATQRNNLAREVLALNERLAEVAARQLAEGEISRLGFNLSVVELGRARARELARRREQQDAAVLLSLLVGLPPNSILAPVLDGTTEQPPLDAADPAEAAERTRADTVPALDVDSLTALALRLRPDLHAKLAAIRNAEALVSLSRREALPNFLARSVLEPAGGDGGTTVRPGLGVSLPVFNRNQGQTAALRAAARQTELERQALTVRVRAEVSTAVTAYLAAAAEVAVLENTVLKPARQNRALVEIAYREGKVGIAELLLIQNQAIDAELDYWAAWLAGREALATLAEVTAQNIARGAKPPPGP